MMEDTSYQSEQEGLVIRGQPRIATYFVVSAVVSILAGFCILPFMDVKFVPATVVTILVSMAILPNVLRWLSGSLDLYNPFAISSVIGFMIFCVFPIMHMLLDFWYIRVDGDIGMQMLGLQSLTLVSYLIYLGTYSVGARGTPKVAYKAPFHMRQSAWNGIAAIHFLIAVPIVIYFQVRFDLLTGGLKELTKSIPLGIGTFLTIVDALVIVIAITMVVNVPKLKSMSKFKTYSILVVVLCIAPAYLGLRGSRGIMVVYLVWTLGILHYRLTPIPRWLVITGMILLVPFFAAYRVFKDEGVKGLPIILQGETSWYLKSKRIDTKSTLLTEIGRTDVARFVIQETFKPDFPYQYGNSYLMAFVSKVPRFIWFDKPWGLSQVLDDLEHGEGNYAGRLRKSAKVSNIIGESTFNFGIFGVPVMFAVLGYFVGRYTRWIRHLSGDDDRLYLLPIFTYAVSMLFLSDSANIVAILFRFLLIPAIMVWLASDHRSASLQEYMPDYEQE